MMIRQKVQAISASLTWLVYLKHRALFASPAVTFYRVYPLVIPVTSCIYRKVHYFVQRLLYAFDLVITRFSVINYC